MKLLANKFLIIGTLVMLLVSIPLTLYLVKKQQEVRSNAAPTSKLYFNPESPNTSTQCTSFNVDLMVDPGQNIVSIVDFYIKYDPTKLDVTQIKADDPFSTVVRPSSINSGTANMSVSVGADVTKAVQTISKVATITFTPKTAGPAQITIDQTQSRVFSLAPSDQPTENVLNLTSPSNVNVGTGACPTGSTITPTPGGSTITPTGTINGGGITPTAVPNPTGATGGVAPVCTNFSVSPGATGSAPFSVLFTANGNDPDTNGLITKTTFTFGDGQTQDVTAGMNLKNVTVQTNHTYQTGNTYNATVVFTDNTGKVSTQCSQPISVTGTASATVAPTAAATTAPTSIPVAKPTVAPTIPATGSITQTLGIIGAVALTVIGGFILLAL